MEQKHDVALIGYGYWGKKLYRYLQESEAFNLRYIYAPHWKGWDPGAVVLEYGPCFVPSLDTIWSDETVTSVVICTPIDTHFELALMALQRGKHVLVEKPLALTAGEAWLLAREAAAAERVLMTDFTWTFSKGLQCVEEMVSEGEIGAVRGASITWRQLGRFTGNDVYAVLGSHALSVLDMFVPLEECVFSAVPMMRTEGKVTSGMILVSWPWGRGYIEVSLDCPVKERRVVVYGDRGTVVWDPGKDDTLVMATYDRSGEAKQKRQSFQFDEGHNLRYALEEFDLVLQGKESNVGRAVKVTEILEGLR